MKKNVLIFGTSRLSSLAWYVLSHDSNFIVIGFTIDSQFINYKTYEGLPVIPFEEVQMRCPPETTSVLVPTGYTRINGLRMDKYLYFKESGYNAINYVSGRASVWPDLELFGNCMIFENTVVQPFSVIGENVIIRSSAHISHHCSVGNHSFLAAGVTLGGSVEIGERCFLGLGSIVRDKIKIADRTFIGAGAVVVSDTEPDGVYVGNPAKKTRKTSIDVT